MANRTMEAKELKLKRMRRAWNRYGNIKTAVQPNRVIINEYKLRAKGLSFDDTVADKVALGFKGVPPGKVEALKRQAELEVEISLDLCVSGPGVCNKYQTCKTYFNSKRDQYVIVLLDHNVGVAKRSITYTNKEVMRVKWEQSRITWVSTSPIPAR